MKPNNIIIGLRALQADFALLEFACEHNIPRKPMYLEEIVAPITILSIQFNIDRW